MLTSVNVFEMRRTRNDISKDARKSFSRDDYKQLKHPDANTPYEALYRSFFMSSMQPEEELYIIQQIHLKEELEWYDCKDGKPNENVFRAFKEYAKYLRTTPEDACEYMYYKHIESADGYFRRYFGRLLNKYDFSEYKFEELTGYNRSSINRFRNEKRSVPKALIFAIAIFFEYDWEQCEELFLNSPHPLHNFIPDKYFKKYVESDCKGIQPFVDYILHIVRKENEERKETEKPLVLNTDFFRFENPYTYLVVSDFKTDNGYDFSKKRIDELEKITADERQDSYLSLLE